MSHTVLLTDHHSDADPVVLPITGGRFSWGVGDVFSANAEAWTADLWDAGVMPPSVLAGKELVFTHPTLPTWRGPVTAPNPHGAAGVTEIVAKDYAWYLSGRRTPKASDTGMAAAGYVWRRAVEDRYRASDPIGVEVLVRSSRALVPAVQRATDLLVLTRDLIRRTGEEIWVDHDARRIEWTRRAGEDKSASVVVQWGREVIDYDYQFDVEAIFNEVLAVPTLAPYDRTRSVNVRDDASVARYRLRQTVAVVPNIVTRAALRSQALAYLGRVANQGDTLQLTLDASTDAWADIRPGDSITAVLPDIDLRCRTRVMVMVYDTDEDTLELSTEVEAEI